MATDPGDLVLDSFAGSGTTGAVAHKMGRRWIMVELGDHAETHILPRLKKVVVGDDPGGVTEATGWNGGGGFRYYTLAPSQMAEDEWGRWVINPAFNAELLARALCKLEGFDFAPSAETFWQHGRSSERDFLYATTQPLTRRQIEHLAEEVGPNRSLVVYCAAHRVRKTEDFPNLTLKKIPKSVLAKCEWGRDDYSLEVRDLPPAPPEDAAADGDGPAAGETRSPQPTLDFETEPAA